jgi:hypothetical protein
MALNPVEFDTANSRIPSTGIDTPVDPVVAVLPLDGMAAAVENRLI